MPGKWLKLTTGAYVNLDQVHVLGVHAHDGIFGIMAAYPGGYQLLDQAFEEEHLAREALERLAGEYA